MSIFRFFVQALLILFLCFFGTMGGVVLVNHLASESASDPALWDKLCLSINLGVLALLVTIALKQVLVMEKLDTIQKQLRKENGNDDDSLHR